MPAVATQILSRCALKKFKKFKENLKIFLKVSISPEENFKISRGISKGIMKRFARNSKKNFLSHLQNLNLLKIVTNSSLTIFQQFACNNFILIKFVTNFCKNSSVKFSHKMSRDL